MAAAKPRGRTAGIIVGAIAALLALGVIAALIGVRVATRPPAAGRDPLPITYQFNTWLADDYANGLGTQWEASGTPIGTSPDRSLILMAGGKGERADGSSVAPTTIYEVATGAVVHEYDDLNCEGSTESINGTIFCTGAAEGEADFMGNWEWVEHPIVALDMATGAVTEIIVVDDYLYTFKALGVRDGIVYALAQAQRSGFLLTAVNMATHSLEWVIPAEENYLVPDCALAGEHLGCSTLGRIQVFSTTDGSVELDIESPDVESVTWTSEAVVWSPWLAEESTISYYDGRTETTTDYPRQIYHDSVVVPLTELLDARYFDEVDIDGRVVMAGKGAWAYDETVILETGAVPDVPDFGIPTSSEHGKVFAWDISGFDPMPLYDINGNVIATIDGDRVLTDGILTSTEAVPGAITTTVLPPA